MYMQLLFIYFSGESAFHSLLTGFGWAKNPMIKRVQNINNNVPITFIYGQDTWMDQSIAEIVKKERLNGIVNIEVLQNNCLIDACINYLCTIKFRKFQMLAIMFLLISLRRSTIQLTKYAKSNKYQLKTNNFLLSHNECYHMK